MVPSRMLTATITPIRRDSQSRHGWHYHLLGFMSISLYRCSSESHQGSRLARTPAPLLTRAGDAHGGPVLQATGRRPTCVRSPTVPPCCPGPCPIPGPDGEQHSAVCVPARKSHSRSQGRPALGDTQLRRAIVEAGQVPGERSPATSSDTQEVTGGKGVTGSNQAVPTQVRGLIRIREPAFWRTWGPRSTDGCVLALLDRWSSVGSNRAYARPEAADPAVAPAHPTSNDASSGRPF